MKNFRVLHLSDIHIGDTYIKSKEIAYRIISDIESNNLNNIQCVIVTGDIFEGKLGYNNDIIKEAIDFFNIIYEQLKQSTNIKKTDFLFVPGNHDILREEDVSKRWNKYFDFLSAFYGTIPDFYNINDFSVFKVYDEYKIVFYGFNSCKIKKEFLFENSIISDFENIDNSYFNKYNISKRDVLELIKEQTTQTNFLDFGEITNEQILEAKRKLKKYDDYNIVSFFHHHFYLFPEVYSKYGDSSLIRNYSTVIQQFQQANIKTILHGHKHFDLERPLITDSYYNTQNIIDIIAGGSLGTSRTIKHTFNIIDFYDKDSDIKLIQRKFVYNNQQLEPIIIKQIPPKNYNNNSSIELLELLKLNDTSLFSNYSDAIYKINIVADDYNNINKWLASIFVGFDNVQKIFNENSLCIFFLLYSMNYRVIKMKEILGKEKIDASYYNILNELLLENRRDFTIDVDKYIKLFEQNDLNILKEKCDDIFENAKSKNEKYYLSFSMIGIFITDMYLMLRYYAGSFYNKYIKYKVNIKLDETEFHQNVPVQKIMIYSDADRRSAFIDLRCNSATSHKLAVLFVKEFELIISKFEDYFKTVGLKLYYLAPKIENNNTQNAIDNYNFEAYIPTLIPLLTGDNIYSKKEVFARELIQNSIDAIKVRSYKDIDFDKTIYITIGESQGRRFFKIKDYGTGMDRFKIERYFTSIGRSFYSGDEYRDLAINYKPISNFGIGFLSAFMICREIEVKTKFYLDDSEGLKLHIPNYDGCFFIEKDNTLDIGTEIILYIDKAISNNIDSNKIIDYIIDTMKDILCDIHIKNEIEKTESVIKSKSMTLLSQDKDILFIPFSENGEIFENFSYEKIIKNTNFINEYNYGLLINISGIAKFGCVLNSGIKLNDTSPENIWNIMFNFKDSLNINNNLFCFNFPSNYLNIDVSREKINNFNTIIKPEFKFNLINCIYKQIMEYISYCKLNIVNNKSINLYYLIIELLYISSNHSKLIDLKNNLSKIKYCLYLRFDDDSIDLIISNIINEPLNSILLDFNNYSKTKTLFKNFISPYFDNEKSNIFQKAEILDELLMDMPINHYKYLYHSDENFSDFSYNKYYSKYHYEILRNFKHIYERLKKKSKFKNDHSFSVYLILSIFYLDKKDKSYFNYITELIKQELMERFSISDIENGKSVLNITIDDITKTLKNNNKKTKIG